MTHSHKKNVNIKNDLERERKKERERSGKRNGKRNAVPHYKKGTRKERLPQFWQRNEAGARSSKIRNGQFFAFEYILNTSTFLPNPCYICCSLFVCKVLVCANDSLVKQPLTDILVPTIFNRGPPTVGFFWRFCGQILEKSDYRIFNIQNGQNTVEVLVN